MANSQNTVTLYKIIVFSYSCGAYYQSDILELLQWNPHFTLLRPKRWPIWTLLSDASKSSCLASLTVLIIRATFWSCYSKILTEPHYNPKDSKFKKLLSHSSKSSFSTNHNGLIIRTTFWRSYDEIFPKLHYDSNNDLFANCCQTPPNHLFSATLTVFIIRAVFCSSDGEIRT